MNPIRAGLDLASLLELCQIAGADRHDEEPSGRSTPSESRELRRRDALGVPVARRAWVPSGWCRGSRPGPGSCGGPVPVSVWILVSSPAYSWFRYQNRCATRMRTEAAGRSVTQTDGSRVSGLATARHAMFIKGPGEMCQLSGPFYVAPSRFGLPVCAGLRKHSRPKALGPRPGGLAEKKNVSMPDLGSFLDDDLPGSVPHVDQVDRASPMSYFSKATEVD